MIDLGTNRVEGTPAELGDIERTFWAWSQPGQDGAGRISDVTGPADLILTGGRVQTHDAARRVAEAIAVREGRIVAVGPARDVRPLARARTRIVELAGRMVLPGFQDAHVHPPIGGLARMRCDLHERRGLDTYLRIVRDYAESHPDEAWIRGGGWHMADFPGGTPRREDLDRVVPDRPVYLHNRDVHGAWVNTRALERAGISTETPDPPDGRIERDSAGKPSGTLHEGAMRQVERLLPPDTAADLESRHQARPGLPPLARDHGLAGRLGHA